MAGGRVTLSCRQRYSSSYVVLILVVFCAHAGLSIPAVQLKGDSSSVCVAGETMPFLGNDFTLCLFLRHFHVEEEQKEEDYTIFTLNQTDVAVRASLSSSYVNVHVNNFVISVGKVPSGVWRRLCLHMHPDPDKVEVSIHERRRRSKKRNKTKSWVESPPGLCLGSTDRKSISADVTAFSVSEEDHPTDCSALVPPGSLLTLDSSSWTETAKARTLEYEVSRFCSEAFASSFVEFRIGRRPQFQTCSSLGGRFVTRGEAQSGLVDFRSGLNSTCVADGQYVTWVQMEVPVRQILECSALLLNGSVVTTPCLRELPCFLCLVPRDMSMELFGDIPAHDLNYTLRVSSEGKFYFQGQTHSTIEGAGREWVLSSKFHTESWKLRGFPVGRREWLFRDGKRNETLTVTPCGREEFSCSDGRCVTREERCDGIRRCADNSDEEGCQVLRKEESYDETASPCRERCTIPFEIGVSFISKVTAADERATLDVSLRLRWNDSRLVFLNLKGSEQTFDCGKIWRPKLIALSGDKRGEEAGLSYFKETCGVKPEKEEPGEPITRDPMMSTIHLGSKNPVYYNITFKVTVRCNFRLHRYPFGSHKCHVSFRFQNDLPFSHSLTKTLNFSGSRDLLEFDLKKVTYETSEDASDPPKNYLVLSLHLKTLGQYHVLNSFGPSALMFFVVFSTLFYPMSDFNERIMVSLTALLVLAALFTQASNSSVKTPYYKLLDVWYAALILICFLVVIINAVVNAMKNSTAVKVSPMPGKVYFESKEGPRRVALFNLVSKVVILFLFATLVIVYVLYSLDAI